MFHNSRHTAITGGTFTVHNMQNSGSSSAFERLLKASAPSAFHNSSARFDPPKCHPNTRVAVLEYLTGWIFGRNDPEALILWLYGPAGAGKSAILQTIAERCFERKVVLASFFFARSDPSRNNFKPLVATIAYQIATAIPNIKPYIESVIEHDPLIFDKSIATQLQSLIIEPLKDLAASGFFDDPICARLLILIDGLDECDDPRIQSLILRALADALHNEKLPIIFLLASRPEQHITLTFNTPPLAGLWRSLVLDNSYKPVEDIRLFLEDSFHDIKSTHPHRRIIPEAWPESSDVDKLVKKSSGQFIYSSVVIKYVAAPVGRPPRRLEVIMGLRPARGDVPFAELDALYMHILGSCADLDTVLSILGLVISDITTEIEYIEVYLDLEAGDVEIALGPLASIIGVSYLRQIQLYHASFGDFLVDITRSGPFYINTLSVKEHLISNCISKLMNPYSLTHHSSDGQPRRWRNLLGALSHPFARFQAFHDISLTETVENALMTFSLPRFWSIWSPEPWQNDDYCLAVFVDEFLNFLLGHQDMFTGTKVGPDPRPLGFSTVYAHHLSSFESIIESEVKKYYQDVGLTALVITLTLYDSPDMNFRVYRDSGSLAVRTLFHLTDDLIKLDYDSLCLYFASNGRDLITHYRYLFTGPRKSAEICLDGHKYAQVTLEILEYLCDHPPHSIPYPKHYTPETHSYCMRAHLADNQSPHSLLSRKMVRKTWITGNNFLRKRREEKHRHGVALSTPTTQLVDDQYSSIRNTCDLGLFLLPDMLERSSHSPELVAFMRRCGKNIVFLPKTTRRAIYAMHKYLNQFDGVADAVDKFAVMAIE